MIPILLLLVMQSLGLPGAALDGAEGGIVESLTLVQLDEALAQEQGQGQMLFRIRIQMAFTALTLAFGLLHLILFFFLPRLRSNLFFALFLFSYAVAIFFDFQHLITNKVLEVRLHRAFITINIIL